MCSKFFPKKIKPNQNKNRQTCLSDPHHILQICRRKLVPSALLEISNSAHILLPLDSQAICKQMTAAVQNWKFYHKKESNLVFSLTLDLQSQYSWDVPHLVPLKVWFLDTVSYKMIRNGDSGSCIYNSTVLVMIFIKLELVKEMDLFFCLSFNVLLFWTCHFDLPVSFVLIFLEDF